MVKIIVLLNFLNIYVCHFNVLLSWNQITIGEISRENYKELKFGEWKKSSCWNLINSYQFHLRNKCFQSLIFWYSSYSIFYLSASNNLRKIFQGFQCPSMLARLSISNGYYLHKQWSQMPSQTVKCLVRDIARPDANVRFKHLRLYWDSPHSYSCS